MSEFTFIGNLEICRTGSSKTEETEASLQAEIAATDKLINEVSEQILNLSGHLEELKRKKEVLQKKIDSMSNQEKAYVYYFVAYKHKKLKSNFQ